MDGATGYSYKRIFGKYLTNDVREIQIAEPYLKENFQVSKLIQQIHKFTYIHRYLIYRLIQLNLH